MSHFNRYAAVLRLFGFNLYLDELNDRDIRYHELIVRHRFKLMLLPCAVRLLNREWTCEMFRLPDGEWMLSAHLRFHEEVDAEEYPAL